jgi:chitinase
MVQLFSGRSLENLVLVEFGGGMKKFRFGFGLLGIGLLAGCNLLSPPPQVSITNPGTVTVRSLSIEAKVSDNANSVELMLNGTSLGQKTSPPYTWQVTLSKANDGQNTISGYATNASGGFTYAQPQTFTVNLTDTIKPTVVLTSLGSSAGITLNAAAADDYAVTKVEFYNGATLLATDTTAPYSHAISLSDASTTFSSYTAKAYDATNNSTISNAIQDVWESNNTPATALMLDTMPVRSQAGVILGGSLEGTSPDVDYYAVSMTFAQVLKVRTYSSAGTDTVVRVFDAAGNQVAFNDDANDFGVSDSAINWRTNDNGVFYIAVSAYTDGVIPAVQGANKQYRVSVKVGD